MAEKSKEERVVLVNEIIKEISLHDRRFFYNKSSGLTATISLDTKTGKFWYHSETPLYATQELHKVCLSVRYRRKPWSFPHGGTLWGLVMDFCDYIRTGSPSNGENGYGGLYCPHWGYTDEAMKTIQDKARELGYLN